MPGTFAETATKNARARKFTWVLSGTDAVVGQATPEIGHYRDRCVQAFGTFASGVIAIEGSNDGVNWFAVTDPAAGTAITFSAAGMKQIVESPLYLRATLSDAGDGTTDITVILLASGGEY
jgi:hypothetical protein